MSGSPVKQTDRWLVPLEEGVVTQIQVDFALGLTVDQGLHFRIECPFVVEHASGHDNYDPERVGSVGPLVDLHQAVMTEAAVLFDGGLRLTFADGRVLVVAASPNYEAFSVSGPGPGVETFKFVSLPGGGLAEWTL